MPHKRRRPGQRPTDRYHGIAVASACDDCAYPIGDPEPSEHGLRMAPIHTTHIPALEAEGWITTRYRHQPPDVTCLHYHLQHWEGGHGEDCCGLVPQQPTFARAGSGR
jgi:hypothetical protein